MLLVVHDTSIVGKEMDVEWLVQCGRDWKCNFFSLNYAFEGDISLMKISSLRNVRSEESL